MAVCNANSSGFNPATIAITLASFNRAGVVATSAGSFDHSVAETVGVSWLEVAGRADGESDFVGSKVGERDGRPVGRAEGVLVGSLDGTENGALDGLDEGDAVLEGRFDGVSDGAAEGVREGDPEGDDDMEGKAEGAATGKPEGGTDLVGMTDLVGVAVGCTEGPWDVGLTLIDGGCDGRFDGMTVLVG